MSWIQNPSDEQVALAARLLADEQSYKYHAYCARLKARRALCPATEWTREMLRDRMQMIVTIDRAGTARSISAQAMEVRNDSQDQ